jgi:hypothetical protein
MKIVPNLHADSLLFQTRVHHAQLSSMADLKASMLITMSSIVMTLAVPRVVAGSTHWPLVVLMIFCLATILLAAYAVMPKFASWKRPPTSVQRKNPRFNLLFFGDFSALSYHEFHGEMENVLNDTDRSYEAQLREIHSLGVYLAKTKYRFLRMAYLAFMTGLFASFVAFLFVN